MDKWLIAFTLSRLRGYLLLPHTCLKTHNLNCPRRPTSSETSGNE